MTLKYFSGNRSACFSPCRKQNMPQKYFLARESPLSLKKTPRNFKPLHFFLCQHWHTFPSIFFRFFPPRTTVSLPLFSAACLPPFPKYPGLRGTLPTSKMRTFFAQKKSGEEESPSFSLTLARLSRRIDAKKSVERQTRNGTAG